MTREQKDSIAKLAVVMIFLFILSAIVYSIFIKMTSPDASEGYSVAIVLGVHQNSRTIDLENDLLIQRVQRAVSSYGHISIIIADGEPRDQITTFDFTGDRPDFLERLRRTNAIRRQQQENKIMVLNSIREKRASVEEVDMLLALDTAVRQIAQWPDSDVREILVISSGLSTTGFLNLAIENREGYSRWLHDDPESLVRFLMEENNLPDFDGITVNWSQLGQVGGSQPVLNGTLKSNLQEIWRGVIVNGGGYLVLSPDNPAPGYYGEDFPKVSIVNVRTIEPPPPPPPPPNVVDVNFVAMKPTLINREQAIQDIADWAKFIKRQDSGVFLFGCVAKTDSDDKEYFSESVALGEARANTVRNLFIEEYGIDPESITALGLGYDNPWHEDNGEVGYDWNSAAAERNRRVVIMAANDPFAQSIYEGTWR